MKFSATFVHDFRPVYPLKLSVLRIESSLLKRLQLHGEAWADVLQFNFCALFFEHVPFESEKFIFSLPKKTPTYTL